MVAEGHRLRGLQVGEAGHDGVRFGFRQTQKAFLKTGDFAEDQVDFVTQPQADVGGDLVVARAAGVQLLAGHSDAVGQACFDVHVHVFQVNAPVEGAGFDFALDVFQIGDDLVTLIGVQHAGFFQHRRMGDRTHDVVAVEALVELDGGGESGDEGVDGLAETAAPGLVGLVGAHVCAR